MQVVVNGLRHLPGNSVGPAQIFHRCRHDSVKSAEMRQKAFDDFSTTDDHGMHITGVAKDQNGTEWYIVKNSWGDRNEFKGYLYMSKAYAAYKMTAFLVHKKAVPAAIAKKLGW